MFDALDRIEPCISLNPAIQANESFQTPLNDALENGYVLPTVPLRLTRIQETLLFQKRTDCVDGNQPPITSAALRQDPEFMATITGQSAEAGQIWEYIFEQCPTLDDILVACNLRLVPHVAIHQTKDIRIPLDKKIEAGRVGLVEAVQSYRYDAAAAFGTHASWKIRGAIAREAHAQGFTYYLRGATQAFNRIAACFNGAFNRNPTHEEMRQQLLFNGDGMDGRPKISIPMIDVIIARIMGNQDTYNARQSSISKPDCSLNAQANGTKAVSPAAILMPELFKQAELTKREQAVAAASLVSNMTPEEISQHLGLEVSEVEAVLASALRSLKIVPEVPGQYEQTGSPSTGSSVGSIQAANLVTAVIIPEHTIIEELSKEWKNEKTKVAWLWEIGLRDLGKIACLLYANRLSSGSMLQKRRRVAAHLSALARSGLINKTDRLGHLSHSPGAVERQRKIIQLSKLGKRPKQIAMELNEDPNRIRLDIQRLKSNGMLPKRLMTVAEIRAAAESPVTLALRIWMKENPPSRKGRSKFSYSAKAD